MDLPAWFGDNGLYLAFALAGAGIAFYVLWKALKPRGRGEPYSILDHLFGVSMWDRVLRIDESDPVRAHRLRRRVLIGWLLFLLILIVGVTFF